MIPPFLFLPHFATKPGHGCDKQPNQSSNNTVEPLLEPLDRLIALDAVAGSNVALHPSPPGNTLTGPCHAAVEIHAVDSNGGVVLDAKINVLADAKAKVARFRKVALAQLVLLDLEAALENLLGLQGEG